MASGKKPYAGGGAAQRSGASPKTILIAAIVIIAVAAFGYLAFRPAAGTGVRVVDTQGVIDAQNAGAKVVDVRTAGEFQMGHIPGAVNVPLDQLANNAEGWDREARYVIYCATGARSAEAVSQLTALGFKNIDHFATGMQGWTGKVETGGGTSSLDTPTNGLPVLIEFYTNA